jgi:hypothetical protein
MSDTKARGSKAEVWHGTARKTPGGLTKKDLVKTRKGRIVSRRKQAAGKKAIKRLFALGYKPKKGKFSLMRKSMSKGKKSSRRTRKRGGGDNFADGFAEDFSGKQGFADMNAGFKNQGFANPM